MAKAAQKPVEGRAAKGRAKSDPNPGKPLKPPPRAKSAGSKRSTSSTDNTAAKQAAKGKNDNALIVQQVEGEDPAVAFAKTVMGPAVRHSLVAASYANGMMPKEAEFQVSLVGSRAVLEAEGERAASGDMALASRLLISQAITLDAMFTELARRASANMGTHLDAAGKYAGLALKAQSNSRTTLEALAKLHQPREQTVRHVHVGQGGQAVVAEQFHHHAGGPGNVVHADQCHAQGPRGPALLCENTGGNGVPIPGSQGCEALPDARGEGGSAKG